MITIETKTVDGGLPPELFQQKILSWYNLNGRKDLPWQKNITPYRVWLSEVMLQQTQVATVIPYFNRFIQHYPEVEDLAAAPVDSVLQLWSGLGYYARARNLHKTAQIINRNKGIFPENLSSLLELPGIGRSTAGAILSIAFNNSHPILDGNVKRVLARYRAVCGWTGQTLISKTLWTISAHYTPVLHCADYTQAMMDLGATLCTRSKPLCEICPIQSTCQARIENRVHQLPTPKSKNKSVVKQTFFLILQNTQKQTLLEKRPDSGIWGGLWSFPEFTSVNEIELWCLEKNFSVLSLKQVEQQRHSFSHFHLDYTAILVTAINPKNIVMEVNQSVWYKTEQISALGLPAPIKKLLQNHT